jgi:peptidoglycan-N-acetylglucosamine deacetylase
VLWLTYDDGPDPEWTPRVLDALAAHGAIATFFVLGPCAERHPELVTRAMDEGHEIGLHADEHVRHTERSEAELRRDTDAALGRLAGLGVRPSRWRTPWGVQSPATPGLAAERGLELVHWTVDTHDWRGDTAGEMLAACRPGLEPGAVVLMHDGLGPGALRGGCEETVELTHLLLDEVAA